MILYFIVISAVVAVIMHRWLESIPRATVPDHLANHRAYVVQNLISHDTAEDLMKIIFEMEDFPSNVDQSRAQKFAPKHEHVGEAVPVDPIDGTCKHHLLVPNFDNTLCVFPSRIDLGRHFILTGGVDGKKENVDDMVDRVSSFGRFTFMKDLEASPAVNKLFEDENFVNAAKSVCPKSEPYLDAFQFNFIMQVPGQTVAMHLDAPYFWGATRYHFPQWLLVCMVFSNLFSEKFVNQIQVVAYLNRWSEEDTAKAEGGEFVYYTNSSSVGTVKALPLAGTIVDGSKTLHAARIYNPSVKAPHMDRNKPSGLKHIGNDSWVVYSGDDMVQKYATKDLRIAIVYRARCFTSSEKAQEYKATTEEMSLEYVLDTLKTGIIRRRIKTADELKRMSGIDLAYTLMDSYIKYPLPPTETALIPYNYCAISMILPVLKPVTSIFC